MTYEYVDLFKSKFKPKFIKNYASTFTLDLRSSIYPLEIWRALQGSVQGSTGRQRSSEDTQKAQPEVPIGSFYITIVKNDLFICY